MGCDGSSSSRFSGALLAAGTASLLVAITAFTTHKLTKRAEDNKHNATIYRQYQREKMLKEKTAEARKKETLPESGTLLDDVKIDKVYLWECEDLRKRFPPALVENKMKFATAASPDVRSPVLRVNSTAAAVVAATTTTQAPPPTGAVRSETSYNKLITDHECILGEIVRKPNMATYTVAYMRAGPRRQLHFNPQHVSAAIVTCGGLCPGLNNVIREITNTLHQLYGIGGTVYGIQGGYQGFHPSSKDDEHFQPIILTPALVENIHHSGGTCLGSSRGGFDLDTILDFVNERGINQLYVIGGDGTHRGAFRIRTLCETYDCESRTTGELTNVAFFCFLGDLQMKVPWNAVIMSQWLESPRQSTTMVSCICNIPHVLMKCPFYLTYSVL